MIATNERTGETQTKPPLTTHEDAENAKREVERVLSNDTDNWIVKIVKIDLTIEPDGEVS